MRFLKKIFKRKSEIERIEAMHKIFNQSRAEDVSKAFELGRIDAIGKLRNELYITIVLFIAFMGIFVVPKYIDSIVDQRVKDEVNRRIEDFSKFYSYTKEV